MKAIQLYFPGDFQDAYVYMGKLVLVTGDQTLRMCDIDATVDRLSSKYFARSPVLTWLFSRNDWLSTEIFGSILKSDSMARGLLDEVERFPNSVAVEPSDVIVNGEQEIPLDGGLPLDMEIYARRLYIGATTGLYHIDIDWPDRDHSLAQGRFIRRLDAKCIRTLTGYGAISASCGDDGLFVATDEFGWWNSTSESRIQQLANSSIDSSWLRYDLINYPVQGDPLLLKTENEQTSRDLSVPGEERAGRVITEIGIDQINLHDLFQDIQLRAGIGHDDIRDDIQFAYNSTTTIFIHTWEGKFFSVGLQTTSAVSSPPTISFVRTYDTLDARILSVHPIRVGVHPSKAAQVLETEDEILLFSDGSLTPLINEQALSVRTFARSKRFKHLAAVTTENGVTLVSLLDDAALRARLR